MRALSTLLLLSSVLLASAPALARMGGGENYGGSSSSSSSFDSSSTSGAVGELAPETFFAVFGSLAGISVLVLGLSIVVKASRRRAVAARRAAQVAEMRRADPDFDLDAMLERTREVFLRCQEAWFRRDLTPVRALMSDATFQRLRTQLALMERLGVRDAIATTSKLKVDLLDLIHGEHFDTAHLRISGELKDTEVPATFSDDEARAVAEAEEASYFSERWSFVRRTGVRTRGADGLLQGKCPNCGAPTERAETNACTHCNAIVNSGNYDWTLAEITQTLEEDTGLPESRLAGLAEARSHDPALNVQMLEDRAALVFWRWIDSQSRGDARRLAKLALPECIDALARELEPLQREKRRRVFVDCAVGAVDLRSLRRNGQRQLAELEVRWSARSAELAEGESPQGLERTLRHTRLTLVRSASARTRLEEGMSTGRCAGCRATLTDSLSPACDYCGRESSAGDDWVLAAESTQVTRSAVP